MRYQKYRYFPVRVENTVRGSVLLILFENSPTTSLSSDLNEIHYKIGSECGNKYTRDFPGNEFPGANLRSNRGIDKSADLMRDLGQARKAC